MKITKPISFSFLCIVLLSGCVQLHPIVFPGAEALPPNQVATVLGSSHGAVAQLAAVDGRFVTEKMIGPTSVQVDFSEPVSANQPVRSDSAGKPAFISGVRNLGDRKLILPPGEHELVLCSLPHFPETYRDGNITITIYQPKRIRKKINLEAGKTYLIEAALSGDQFNAEITELQRGK